MPLIKTSSWYATLPADHIKIGVSRGTPRGLPAGYKLYKTLAPGPWFSSVGVEEYKKRYFSEILDKLDPATVVKEIEEKAAGKIPVLVCYETADDPAWCHRGFISAWLKDKLGLLVPEVGFEDQGCEGWFHPKLPLEYKTR